MKRLCVWLGVFLCCLSAGAQTATTTNVLNDIPQFGVYDYSGAFPSGYTPPPGVVMLYSGTWYSLAKLTAAQQQEIGSDLSAKVTKFGGCDAFDRTGSVFYLAMNPGQQPTTSDLANGVTMMHFQTPFTVYTDANPTYIFPLMNIQQYAPYLADTTHDIWMGIVGGSNPNYANLPGQFNPCYDSNGVQDPNLPLAPYPTGITTAQAQGIFAMTGFSYSLDLSWTQPAVMPNTSDTVITAVAAIPAASGSTTTPAPLSYYDYTSPLPITGTIDVPTPSNGASTVTGTVTVNIDSHGGHAEYMFNTENTLDINGSQFGSPFSTQADCSSYGTYSPDGNPGIFSGTTGNPPSNPRNWCPGAPARPTTANPGTPNPTDTNFGTPVVAQVFPYVTLNTGTNTFSLNIGPSTNSSGPYVPGSGDTYVTSINFAPDTPQNGIATTTTLTSSQSPSSFGQAVMFTATVVPLSGNPIPQGSVQFLGAGIPLGVSTLNSAGVASLTSDMLAVGSQNVIAVFIPTSSSYNGSIGSLTQVVNANTVLIPLTAMIIGTPTKGYDGTTIATLTPANYQLTGFIGTDSATVTQTVGTYAAATVGAEQVTATLTATNFTPNGTTNLAAYALPTIATGPGDIVPATVVNTINDGDTNGQTSADGDPVGIAANCNAGNADTCTLRDALAAIGIVGGGSIAFDPTVFGTPQTITLTGGLDDDNITTLSILGPGVNLLSINGAGQYTVFTNEANASISNLTTTNGGGGLDAGGIENYHGVLTLNNLNITGNNAPDTFGGGLYNQATLIVLNSTISNNVGPLGGGLLIIGGSTVIINSTIAGNSGVDIGLGDPVGGIYDAGTLTLINSTVTGNSTTADNLPGGIYVYVAGANPYVGATVGIIAKTENNIIAGNTSPGPAADLSGFTPDTSNITSAAGLNLASLGNYGGPTQTMIPLPGSTAICAGTVANALNQNGAPLTTDQRGTGYPRTTSYVDTPCVDAGAVQTNYSLVFATQPTDALVNTAITPSPSVQVDESGAPFAFAGASIPVVLAPGSTGQLVGTASATTNAAGLATFAGLSVNAVGSGDTLVSTLESGDTAITTTSNAFSTTGIGTTTSLTVSSTSITPGQTVTLTAVVTPATGVPATGSVNFYDGATLLQTVQLSGGSASLAVSTLTAGITNEITAVYSGNAIDQGSSSAAIGVTGVTVAPSDFTFTNTGASTSTVASGAVAAYSFALAPLYSSYAGPVSFTVTGLPTGKTASFTPNTVAVDAGATSVTMSVQTGTATAYNEKSNSPLERGIMLALLFLPFLGRRSISEKLKGRMLLLLLLMGGLTATLSGCSSNNGPKQSPQTYMLTVTATGGALQHSQTVTLIVQ